MILKVGTSLLRFVVRKGGLGRRVLAQQPFPDRPVIVIIIAVTTDIFMTFIIFFIIVIILVICMLSRVFVERWVFWGSGWDLD